MQETYKVGQAPWETQSTPTASASSYPVGKAPWETPTQAPVTPAPTPEPQKPFDILDNPVTRAIQTIFPGKQIGAVVGGAIHDVSNGISNISKGKDFFENNTPSLPTPLQVTGDVINTGLTLAAPGVGTGESVAGRVLANTALGAGLGGSKALSEGGGLKETALGAGEGAAIGGTLSGVSEALGTVTKSLPNWFVKQALPKLNPENAQYVLENTKLGTIKTLATQSKNSLANYENRIQTILSHPEFKSVSEDSKPILQKALDFFKGNSNYSTQDILTNARDIAPDVSGLIDKFEAGQADIQEINTIRRSLDSATKSVYTKLSRPPESKALGAALANGMRDFVQTNAPETVDIFTNYAKEIDLQRALTSADKKNSTFKDLLAGATGFYHSGFKGALEAILLERGLTNPSVRIGLAKGLSAGKGVASKIAQPLIEGAKAPLIDATIGK